MREFRALRGRAQCEIPRRAEIDIHAEPTGNQLTIKAPRIKGEAPKGDASLIERVQCCRSRNQSEVLFGFYRVSRINLSNTYLNQE
ncbi:MAG: hypothetical protein QM707_00995, partial [Arenimonas sp.]